MEGSFGLIEIVLGFGAVLAAALFELRRNKRALAEQRRRQAGPPPDGPGG